MSIGTLYYSHSTTREKAEFKSIPFSNATIDWKREEASTMSFKSPVKLEEADRIRYKSNTTDFGGQIYKKKKTLNDIYEYEVISYVRLYHDQVNFSCTNMTSSQILKKVLGFSANNFTTSGIKSTSVVHSSLKWEKTSIWDIAQQLCWLEHKAGYEARCYVDANGTLIFKYIDEQQEGYTFTNAYSYNEEYDTSDIITMVAVTQNGNLNDWIASATASKDMIAKWGYILEYDECSSTKSSSTNSSSTSSTNTDLKDTAQISKYNIPSKIVKQALSIAKKGNSQYDNLKLLFNWCNKNISYVGYSNSKRGALGCLNKRGGNCCDNANLLIAMARSIGIKCRYAHAKMGVQGHVYGEYYVNGKWLVVDTGTTASKRQNKYWGSHWNGFGDTDRRYDVLTF